MTGDEEEAAISPAALRVSSEAVRERPLDAPAESGQLASAGWGELSAGEDPVACLLLAGEQTRSYTGIVESIACYAPGSSEPVVVPAAGRLRDADAFALRADAPRSPWSAPRAQTYGTIAVSKLDGLRPAAAWRTGGRWPGSTTS